MKPQAPVATTAGGSEQWSHLPQANILDNVAQKREKVDEGEARREELTFLKDTEKKKNDEEKDFAMKHYARQRTCDRRRS